MNVDPALVELIVGSYAAKVAIEKFVGPIASHYGDEFKDGVTRSQENFTRILVKAWKRAGEPTNDGEVNLRVLKQVWDEGRFAHDELQTEYFAGVLASSRTDDGKDDRSLPFVNLLRDMSIPQIRLHYAVYQNLMRLVRSNSRLGVQFFFRRTGLELKGPEIAVAMSDGSEDRFDLGHAMFGLDRLGLIGPGSDYSVDNWRDGFVWIEPTYPGTELFLRAHGLTDADPMQFMAGEIGIEGEPLVPPCPTASIFPRREPPTHDDMKKAIDHAMGTDRPHLRVRPSELLSRS